MPVIPAMFLIPVATRFARVRPVWPFPSFHLDRWFWFGEQVTGHRFSANFLIDIFFDVHDVMREIFTGKADSEATGAGTCSPTDTVNIILAGLRQVEIEYMTDCRDM